MKKQTLGIVTALCFVTMLATVCAQAQSGMTEGRATIPFDFVVNNETLPAGAYTIEHVTQGKDCFEAQHGGWLRQRVAQYVGC